MDECRLCAIRVAGTRETGESESQMATQEQKSEAINVLLDIVENVPEQAEDACALLAVLTNDGRPDEGCVNHIADSWGCCENCGGFVF